jgi:hypothetical protein
MHLCPRRERLALPMSNQVLVVSFHPNQEESVALSGWSLA